MLLNGEKMSFITVGGRTTAVVASVQKKTEIRNEPEKAAEGDPSVDEEMTKAKKSRVTKSAPGKKSKATKELQETTALAQSPEVKSRAVKEEDHSITPGVTVTEGKPKSAEELPETTNIIPAKTSHRKNRAVKEEAGPSIPEPTDTKVDTDTAPTSVVSKKRKAKTEAPPPDPVPTTSAANPPSKKQKLTPSRSSAVATEPVTSTQARTKTKAAAKEDKSEATSKGAIIASAGDGDGETRRRSRRVSGRGPG